MRIGRGQHARAVPIRRQLQVLLEATAFHLGVWGLALYSMVMFTRPPPELLTFYSMLSAPVAGVLGPIFYRYLFRSRGSLQAALAQPVGARSPVATVKKKAEVKIPEPKLVDERGVATEKLGENCEILEEYDIHEPYSKVVIAKMPNSTPKYYVLEARLNVIEYQVYRRISEILAAELNPVKIGKEKDIRKAIVEGAERLAKKYKHAFKHLEKGSWARILYFLQRDMFGFGPINTVMDDFRVEDISCDGVGSPIFVWHRRFESIPTNIIFNDRDVLDEYIVKMAHKSGKHVSSAYPILDAMLYGRHRLAASFRDEVSPKGSTFTIRKFREEPLSVVDLIELRTFSPEIAAYLWFLMEHKTTVMVIGGTGSGKTTALNVLASMVKSGMKLVTVEETAELNIPHENWVQLISRESFGLTGSRVGQVSLFDLVRMSLRYRPDYLIVGEIRGEESFVLFQALATGHGGLSTMHADNLEYCIKRLTSPPMNISDSYIPLMNVVVLIERTTLPSRAEGPTFGRRMRNVWEVVDYGKYNSMAEWIPETDIQEVNFGQSYYLNKIAMKTGRKKHDIMTELAERTRVLKWMVANNIRSVRDVARVISDYYANPEFVIAKTRELEVPQIVGGEAVPVWQETPNPVLEAVMSEGGSIDVERAIRITKLDTITFWNNVEALRRAGYIISGEKSDRGVVKTYLVGTNLGASFYQRMRAGEREPKRQASPL